MIKMEQNPRCLCRICLKVGALHPIFENHNDSGLLKKLQMCFNEKPEDVEGHPRYICDACKDCLDTLCKFISRYKSTNTILQNGLCIKYMQQKLEDCDSSNGDDCLEEIEISVEDVKNEVNIKYELDISGPDIQKGPLQPTNKQKMSRKSKSKTECKSQCVKKKKLSSSASTQNNKLNDSQNMTKKQSTKDEASPTKLCDLCGEVVNRDNLNYHLKKHHSKKEQCPHCPSILASAYYLTRHVKRRHESKRNFSCMKCNKAFTFKGDLNTHVRQVHEKKVVSKTYTCKICNKMYKCKRSYVVHERSEHTGDRPAVCDICGSSFYHKDYLKEHMRLHTGETPFKCPVCGRGCTQLSNMKSHLRVHRISELDCATLSKIRPSHLKLLKA